MTSVPTLIDEADERAVAALLQKRFERPAPIAPPLAIRPPLDKRVYLAVREFLIRATVRSVLYFIGTLFIRRPALWVLDNGYSLISTICSGRVSLAEYNQRQQICDECSAQKTIREHTYCAACGCGRWLLARLDGYKNWKRGHNCSYGLHPGSVATKPRRGGLRNG